jgi:hypothetical protein
MKIRNTICQLPSEIAVGLKSRGEKINKFVSFSRNNQRKYKKNRSFLNRHKLFPVFHCFVAKTNLSC